jgi:hypothetical protein
MLIPLFNISSASSKTNILIARVLKLLRRIMSTKAEFEVITHEAVRKEPAIPTGPRSLSETTPDWQLPTDYPQHNSH